jgi:hypothetical protein
METVKLIISSLSFTITTYFTWIPYLCQILSPLFAALRPWRRVGTEALETACKSSWTATLSRSDGVNRILIGSLQRSKCAAMSPGRCVLHYGLVKSPKGEMANPIGNSCQLLALCARESAG